MSVRCKNKYEGEVFKTNNYGDLVVTEYVNSDKVWVKFVETGYETSAEMGQIKKGTVKDKSVPELYGVGVIGDEPATIGGKNSKEYMFWSNVLKRCYNAVYRLKQPTYIDCTTSENFKHFSYFKEWCNKQIGFGNDGWHLDKDILVKGNKVYSEDTCCFVPREINGLFTLRKNWRGDHPIGVCYNKTNNKFIAQICRGNGFQEKLGTYDTQEESFYVYKEAKEQHIKDVANKWKDQIDSRVYESLMSWNIEITD